MANQFPAEMSKRTNAQLLKIVHEEYEDYQPEAVAAAEEELKKRNLTQEEIVSEREQIENKRQFDQQRANEPLEPVFKILTALFPILLVVIFSGTLKADGYDRKARDIVHWTLYGIAFYLLVLISIAVGSDMF